MKRISEEKTRKIMEEYYNDLRQGKYISLTERFAQAQLEADKAEHERVVREIFHELRMCSYSNDAGNRIVNLDSPAFILLESKYEGK